MNVPKDVASIFGEVLELPPADRAAYLDRVCGTDAALRFKFAALLDAQGRAGRFLGGSVASKLAAETVTKDSPDTSEPSTGEPARTQIVRPASAGAGISASAVIGNRYKLLEPIGAGGMGAVWLAQQTEPVKRRVAVKLIKPGMDSRSVLVRFDAERQALALMDHPNIARVLDAGATPDGRPFFVMELVKGVPITQFCDERKLTPRQRLELFVPVCQAIQHAHQKGVIHRDIKPSNVLVALYDDTAVPKVIDFGIAKATGEALTDKTLHTGFGLVGTPEYMAPEQAELNQLDVDTRADVYALGVLLYELLAGSPPFGRGSQPGAGLLDILRAVREQEPERPSARLSSVAARAEIATNRGTEPRKLTGLVRGELDWIVMRALEKDRNRRYETANGLAKDVERYLAGRTVQAVPPSTGYRARKFVRRNRGAVAAAAVLILAVAIGTTGLAVGLIRSDAALVKTDAALRDAEMARVRAEDERTAAVAARAAEVTQRQRTDEEKRRADAEREVADAVTQFLREDLLGQAGGATAEGTFPAAPKLTVRDALDRAAVRVGNRFAGRPAVEGVIRRTIGEAYCSVGEYAKAIFQLELAVALLKPAPDQNPKSKGVQTYLDTRRSLGLSYGRGPQKRMPEAIRELKQVLADREAAFGPDDEVVLAAVRDLAELYRATANGRMRNELLGRIVVSRMRSLGPDAPATIIARFELAFANADTAGLRKLTPALERIRDDKVKESLPPGQLDAAALSAMNRLALAYYHGHGPGKAIPLLEQLRDGYEKLYGRETSLPLSTESILEHAYFADGRPNDGLAACERISKGWMELQGPESAQFLYAAFNQIVAYWKYNRPNDAIRLLEETLPAARRTFGARHEETQKRANRLIEYLKKTGRVDRAAEVRAEQEAAERGTVPQVAPAPRPVAPKRDVKASSPSDRR